ncbi:hypothetical protein SMACR_04727 [Sordaria macrospora]|uniref:WGS project CABT00000000 data, contig 2.21 n=2 Tax=Sordaria macrospora TaxID=5147 RepID=F7W295_SORMK|nr:uncharacterized protein SMAC_04727 [Sordaria macrospora k-hell]KAA8628968.1 hypothetical protein SMACR_04727 [Sordaria macrospora]KAH7630886.1 hypothetical protein B0T09DRAFT_126499 [Sordaria sp. MPI-SDFR-AT-0083]WPJ62002.1 hypothetical protein SMAC4_04727 [Sordaria macrospora]CCC11745.1 unnamed protein product [Sordaria macrospora k-hell]
MPVLRVRSQRLPPPGGEEGIRTPSPYKFKSPLTMSNMIPELPDMPDIGADDSFRLVIKKLSLYIAENIRLPSTFEQLRTTAAGDCLRHLVDHLVLNCDHPAIVNALLALKWHYGAITEDKGLNDARASGCEIAAWRLLTHLSEREAVDYCLYEIPDPALETNHQNDEEETSQANEHSPLIARAWTESMANPRRKHELPNNPTGNSRRNLLLQSLTRLTMSMAGEADSDDEEEDDPTAPFINLNALEIAAIADAKRFLSQNVVQKIITGIWNGDIVFWDNLSVHTEKKPRFYNPHTADPFSRLRVPKYLKSFEVVFFASFLFLYYAVLVERHPTRITPLEIFLYLWLAAFSYDELSEWIDAGSIFYAADIWNIFDMAIMAIGFTYMVLRIIGLRTQNEELIDLAFDVLALEALFMVPRVCSILSLSPYWGTLIPCLKEMAKDFVKFMVLVVIIYLGFLTTFSLVGRDSFPLRDMTWFLTKIFFGSTFVGFDIMRKIDPVFGPPLMILFVMLSSILLMGSLTGMLSNSFSRVITHAREEYLFVYSIYVLEASTSNRLTHFYPPFNLLALVIFRPLRLFLPSDDKFRRARIILLKATHLPIVFIIAIYEWIRGTSLKGATYSAVKAPPHGAPIASPAMMRKLAGPRREMRGRRSVTSLQSDHQAAQGRPGMSSMERRISVNQARQAEEAQEDATYTERATDVEVRIADLAAKIDRLTELVIAMQTQQSTTLGDVSLS